MKNKALFWFPRILVILAILFLMLFSLDEFNGNYSILRMLEGFLIHNIPAFILLGILILAWTKELAGGILFIIAAFTGCIYFHGFTVNTPALILMVPFFLAGIVFLIHYFYSRNTE